MVNKLIEVATCFPFFIGTVVHNEAIDSIANTLYFQFQNEAKTAPSEPKKLSESIVNQAVDEVFTIIIEEAKTNPPYFTAKRTFILKVSFLVLIGVLKDLDSL